MRALSAAGLSFLVLAGAAAAAPQPPLVALTIVGPPETVFSGKRDACDGNDVPDAPLRAFRDAEGQVVAFGLHYVNRALRGASLAALKIDCRVVLDSGANPDPAAYDEHSWITATWTDDGTRVQALVHHEYQAHAHPGRCISKEYIACWTNTVLALASTDGAKSFARPQPPRVVAGFPSRRTSARVATAASSTRRTSSRTGRTATSSPRRRAGPDSLRARASSAPTTPPTRAPGAPSTARPSRSPTPIRTA
jgi:hypothetical protein